MHHFVNALNLSETFLNSASILKNENQISHILRAFNTVLGLKGFLWTSEWNMFIPSTFASDCWYTMIKKTTAAVFIIFLFFIFSMINIK